MLPDVLQDKAVDYVSGVMTPEERENFEVILEFHDGLRAAVKGLAEAVAAVAVTRQPAAITPPHELKTRILGALGHHAALPPPEALVATDADGRIEWVNDAFTALCGFALEELKGRKPGHVLQGPETDQATVDRIRTALRERRSCCETIVNYHKDGSRYRAEVRIAPIVDEAARPLWFVARERKVS